MFARTQYGSLMGRFPNKGIRVPFPRKIPSTCEAVRKFNSYSGKNQIHACAGMANSRVFVTFGIFASLTVGACMAPPERDPDFDRRLREETLAARPDPMLSLDQDPDHAMTQWILDLDHENPTRFARAKAGLVRAASTARARLYTCDMPASPRGKGAMLEVLMRSPPSVTEPELSDRLCRILIGVITDQVNPEAPDAREVLGLRLQALNWLAKLNRVEDAPVFAERLFDGERSLRWRAAQYFDALPARIRVSDLLRLLDAARSDDLALRADGGRVLTNLYWSLTTSDERVKNGTLSFNPVGSALLRQQQIEAFARWIDADAAEAIVRKSREEAVRGASGSGTSD